ncbi:MAG TPA: hypothetical protein VGQ83_09810 [Polyangia bacterium]|jgi:hypothetical protein
MTDGLRRWLPRGALAATALLVVVRLAQGLAGAVPAMRVAGELGLVLSAAGVALVLPAVLRRASTVALALTAIFVLAWGAGVALPLYRMARPASALYDGQLGGARREVESTPAPSTGRYEVRVKPLGEHRAQPEAGFLLQVRAERDTRIAAGADGLAIPVEVRLAAGTRARLFLERGHGQVEVLVRAVPFPRTFVLLAAALALLLALVADAAALRETPRLRGVLVAVVAASVTFLALVDPAVTSSGRAALGAAGLAVLGGGLLGGVWGLVAGRLGRRAR